MTGSIHRGTASEPQDRSSSAAHSIEVPPEIVRKWQEFVNLLAEIMHVPSASIMRVDPPHIKVFVSSTSKGNPCEPGALDTGPYCETVMKTGQPLLVPDARENEAWKANPHVRLGMISYLGFPIGWPDGRLFGTICVRDNKRNEYSEAYLKLLLHFRDMLQADLKSFATSHQHEAKIRRLVDANIIGIIIWDLEGRILEANDAFLRMGGYDREDLISGRLNRTDLTPPEWRERDARTDAELKMIGAVQPFEKEYFRKDGGRVPVLIGLAAFGEERDQGVAFVLDLTELKRAEEASRGSEARFRDYAESASDWYWETDPDHKFTRLTEDERRLARGFATVSRIGVARWEFATDVQSEPEKWELHRSMLEARQPFRDFVYRATHSDGSVVYNKISGKPVFDSNGEFHGYRGTGSDVTELMRAQEQQTAISEVLRAIVNSPYDLQPIFDAILDSATRLCQADSGALRLSEEGGLRLVAVRGDPFLVSQVWSSIPVLAEKGSLPDRLAASRLPTHIPDFTAVEGDHRDDFSIRVANAGIRTGLFVPLLKDNEIVGIISLARKQVQPFTDKQISLFRDFAAQATIALESTRRERQYREAQMALAHANRVATMGQLTASITHEVNQPITAAVTYALAARRFLRADPPNFREVDDALSLIVKEGDRAGEVVKRVRALVKKVPTRKGTVAIDDAILEVIALTRAEAANNSVSVRTQFAEGLPRVQGDRVQLQQVMLNLIVNAIQAMSGIGEGVRELQISIETVPSAGGVRVGVRDTGPGLSPESLPLLFESFYTTKPDGMGMGLSICRSIIEAHGGRLWAATCEPRGALFQFTIPAD
jgi:PAS domain S-box-containing protein